MCWWLFSKTIPYKLFIRSFVRSSKNVWGLLLKRGPTVFACAEDFRASFNAGKLIAPGIGT